MYKYLYTTVVYLTIFVVAFDFHMTENDAVFHSGNYFISKCSQIVKFV